MKFRTWAVSAGGAALLGVAILPSGARAAPPRQVDPFFTQREASAPPAVKAKLAQHRQQIQASHFGYAVA